jgi:hypothetical protein
MKRSPVQLFSNPFKIFGGGGERIVAYIGAGSGIGVGPVVGDLAVMAFASGGSKGFSGGNHRIKLLGGDAKIDNFVVFIIVEASGMAKVLVDQIPSQLDSAILLQGRQRTLEQL